MRDLSDILLEWYDVNARDMPWRVPPNVHRRSDPYKVWMSEIMLQQTTVAAVEKYFRKFTENWPTVFCLAAAEDADVMAAWAGLGYYARARNLLKCARVVVADYDGEFPKNHADLLKLPGVGPYTAAAIASIAFDLPVVVVDGNVERVMARFYDIHQPLPGAKAKLTALAEKLTPQNRPGDYAQAVMDLGATVCIPRNPKCEICAWQVNCAAYVAGTAAELPKKTPKKKVPTRYGIAYVGRRNDGAYLLEARPDKGLLGGMLGWPGSEWNDDPKPCPPVDVAWREVGEARHTFTHFHLRLKVFVADIPINTEPAVGQFVGANSFAPDALPTAMRKVYDVAMASKDTP